MSNSKKFKRADFKAIRKADKKYGDKLSCSRVVTKLACYLITKQKKYLRLTLIEKYFNTGHACNETIEDVFRKLTKEFKTTVDVCELNNGMTSPMLRKPMIEERLGSLPDGSFAILFGSLKSIEQVSSQRLQHCLIVYKEQEHLTYLDASNPEQFESALNHSNRYFSEGFKWSAKQLQMQWASERFFCFFVIPKTH